MILLGLIDANDNTALPNRANRLQEGLALLNLVTLAKCRILQPAQQEQDLVNLADFLKGEIELVLTLVSGEVPSMVEGATWPDFRDATSCSTSSQCSRIISARTFFPGSAVRSG